jgi:hypothetical protein
MIIGEGPLALVGRLLVLLGQRSRLRRRAPFDIVGPVATAACSLRTGRLRNLRQPLDQSVTRTQIKTLRHELPHLGVGVHSWGKIRGRGDDPFRHIVRGREHSEHAVQLVERYQIARGVGRHLIEVANREQTTFRGNDVAPLSPLRWVTTTSYPASL